MSRQTSNEFYYSQHRVCPKCRGGVWHTCVGTITPVYRDTNKAGCTKCDWEGIVHDLVPECAPPTYMGIPIGPTRKIGDDV